MKYIFNGWCESQTADEMADMLECAAFTIRGGGNGGHLKGFEANAQKTGEWWIGVVMTPNESSSPTPLKGGGE